LQLRNDGGAILGMGVNFDILQRFLAVVPVVIEGVIE